MIAWSELSHVQRAWMLSRRDDVVVAKAMKVAFALDGKYRRTKIEAAKVANIVAVAKFEGVVVKCAPGRARGITKSKPAGALPMQFYGAHGIG